MLIGLVILLIIVLLLIITLVGGNLLTWRCKKQNVVARSNVEAEYRVITHTACELMWIQSLF